MFTNLKWNVENVWVGDSLFKFYHSQRCPICNYSAKGFNDLKSEGPWDFTCFNCNYEWTVVMTPEKKLEREKLLFHLKEIDEKITFIKKLNRTHKKI